MVETIRVVRSMLRGERGVDGQVFPVRADAKLDFPRFRAAIPVYVGAVNGRMLRASGAWADGVQLGAIVSPGYVRWAWEQIARGAIAAGRDPSEIDLVSNVLVSVDPDPRPPVTRCARAGVLHPSRRASGSVDVGRRSERDRARAPSRARRRSRGRHALVTDGLIDAFAAAGDPDHVAARLQEYVAGWLTRRARLARHRP